jgi:Mrp family chromosome partitioning ATPase
MNRPMTTDPIHNPPLPALFAVGGCKGGVGKTMVALALLDYLLRRDRPILLIEGFGDQWNRKPG